MKEYLPVGHLPAPDDHTGYTLRFVPPMNLAALSRRPRQDKALLLWYCLRAVDVTGRGVLDQSSTVDILCTHFGYKRQTVYNHLQKGSSVYWRLHRSRRGQALIILRGLLFVTRYLGASIGKATRFVEMPASDLPDSSQGLARRALIYNSGTYAPLTGRVHHPISRHSLQEKTGVAPRQQRRYDQASERYGAVRIGTFGQCRDSRTGRLRAQKRVVQTDSGWFITDQLPNRYQTYCVRGRRGMLPRIARTTDPGDQSSAKGEATSGRIQRRYFRSFRALIKAGSRGEATHGYYLSRWDDHLYVWSVAY